MKWFLILFAAALAAYFLWIKGHLGNALPEKLTPMIATETPDGAAAETPDAGAPEKVEIKSITPEPKKGEKIYTEEDIRKINEKALKASPRKNGYTNADLKKYKERPGKPETEKVKKEIKWAEDPEKKSKKK